MTLEKGQPWGEPGRLAPDGFVCDSDAAVSDHVRSARLENRHPAPVGLVGGDLCRTLGGRGDRRRLVGDDAVQLTVDIGRARIDDQDHWFAAHCIARRWAWRGTTIGVMNAAFLGSWNVAPRAHPGDGRLDVLEADLGWGDRWKARQRLPGGTHVPHPGIAQRRVTAGEWSFERPIDVYIDGRRHRRVRRLAVEIEPEALGVVV
ncbi:MAG: hypothetical protein OEW42_00815 [Acidimicrobiia bacterium]|nr:hypothetical protein [Acidimicrobiia bacterium]MDH5237906.1 hypothetical protein [Acidimicrobiia bacterium]